MIRALEGMQSETRDVAYFVFTDVVGSTALWERERHRMVVALGVHDALLEEELAGAGGRVIKHTGDGVLAVFDDAVDAIRAAVSAELRMINTAWPTRQRLRVRFAIHGGPGDDPNDGWFEREHDYVGPGVNRCARLVGAAHGDQVLCSRSVATSVAGGDLDPDIELHPLGEHAFRGLSRTEHVYQVTHDCLPAMFPPLRGAEAAPCTPNRLRGQLRSRARDRAG